MPKRKTQSLARDCTLEKKELLEQVLRYEQVMQHSCEWYWEVDQKGLYTYVSPGIKKVLGYTPKEVVGKKHFYDFFDPKQKETLKKEAFKVFKKELKFKDFNNLNRHKNGKEVWLSTSGIPFYDKNGTWLGYRGSDLDISSRKGLEIALAEKAQLVHITLSGIGDGVISTDMKGKIVEINPIAQALTGWKKQKAIGQPIGRVFHIINKETRKRCEDPVAKVLKTGGVIGLVNDTLLVSHDGTERVISDSGAPIRNTNGDIVGVVLVFRDDTERHEAERRLKEHEARFRGLFDHMSSAVAVYRPVENGKNFVFVGMNRAGERIENIKAKEVIGKKVTEVFPGVKQFGLLKIFQEVSKTGRTKRFPLAFYQDARISGWRDNYVFKLPSGEIVAVYDDKTTEKQSEKALRDQKEFAMNIVNTSLNGLYIYDLQSHSNVFINPQYTKITGYTLKELNGFKKNEFNRLFHPDDLPKVLAHMGKVVKSKRKKVFEIEYRFKKKDGSWIWCLSRDTVFSRDASGKVTQFLGTFMNITRLKESEMHVKDSEQKLRTIFNSTNDMMMVQDIESGEILEANAATLKQTGYSFKELRTIGVQGFSPQGEGYDPQKVLHHLQLAAKGKPQHFEWGYIDKRGNLHQTEVDLMRIRINENDRLLAVARDVTDKKMSEDALRASEEQLKAIANSAQDSIFIKDIHRKYIYTNPAMVRLFGCSKGCLLGKTPEELFDKESAAQIQIADDTNFINGKGYKGVHTLAIGEKEHVFQTIQSPLKDKNGKIVGCCGIVRDITKIISAKRSVEESEREYRSIFEAVTDILVLLDHNGVVLAVNSRFSQETGYGKKDVVGKNMKELGYLFEQKSFADVLTKFQARWGGKTVRSYIAQVITKSGKVREYEITAKMIKAKKGEQMRELAVFHDVTEERKARKIIRDANRRLEEMVERRTTELRKAQGQLVQQEKMAALGKMASVFAHEIRNPLGVMKLAAYSLRKLAKDGDKKALSHLRHIDEKIEESNRIIHDMLVFARGTSIVKTEVDLNKLVQKTCDENGEMIRAMGVEVKKELDPNMTTFMADPVHVTEVLCNLATNAAQAMEKKKKKRITIRTYQKDKWVYLEVQDTGMGMTKETQKRLGEPFFSTKVKGIGLGLYITYEIVKKHGGTISVVSELGKGTTFTIALPVNTNAYDKKTKNSHR